VRRHPAPSARGCAPGTPDYSRFYSKCGCPTRAAARGRPRQSQYVGSLPCAGGGKGPPGPLHPRPGTASLGSLIRCIDMPSDWRACLREDQSWQHTSQVLAYHKHAPMVCLSGKHHMQGVWGRAAPPMGSARGKARSHPRTRMYQPGARGQSPHPKTIIEPIDFDLALRFTL